MRQKSKRSISKKQMVSVVTRLPTKVAKKKTTAPVPLDPLRLYLKEVQKYSLLSIEEERKLAFQYQKTQDPVLAKRLITANLRLVVKIAFEYRNAYLNLMDLIQEGNMGLLKAFSKFDPTKGARLSYYASWWIRSYILKYILDNFRLVRMGTTRAQKKLFYHLMREKEKLENQGLLPSPELLSQKLQVQKKDVIEMEKRLSPKGGEVSLDSAVYQDGQSPSFQEFLKDEKKDPEAQLIRAQWLHLLKKKLPLFEKELSEREVKILKERWLVEKRRTLQSLADQYHLTRERVRQIEGKLLYKLRKFFQKDLMKEGKK